MDKLRPELTSKSIELMYFQASNAYASSLAAGAILAVVFWNYAPRIGIVGWVLAYGLMIGIRHVLGMRFRAAMSRGENAQRWLLYFATVVGISGIIWGVYGAFLALYAPDTYQLAVVILALGALLSGAVVAYSVSLPVYLAFSIPTMVPIALWMVLSPVNGKRFLGMMVFVWVIFMMFAARRFRRFALESLGYQCNLEELARQLRDLSSIDSLTNLTNRSGFDERLDSALLSAKREAAPLGLILCEIDCFKQYNDAYGQMHGDVCVRSIAGQLDTGARRLGATAARIGGDEFAVILRPAEPDSAVRLAEELRAAVEQLRIVHAKSQTGGFVTCSFGVCTLPAADVAAAPDLMERAQEALREAQRAGRNRVHASSGPAAPSSAKPSEASLGDDSRPLKSAHV